MGCGCAGESLMRTAPTTGRGPSCSRRSKGKSKKMSRGEHDPHEFFLKCEHGSSLWSRTAWNLWTGCPVAHLLSMSHLSVVRALSTQCRCTFGASSHQFLFECPSKGAFFHTVIPCRLRLHANTLDTHASKCWISTSHYQTWELWVLGASERKE